MEFVYGFWAFVAVVSIIATITGLVEPSLFRRLLKKRANRKTVLALGVGLFLFSTIMVGVTEPESIKQERLLREQQQQRESSQPQKAEEVTAPPAQDTARPAAEKTNPDDYWHKVISVVDGDTVKAQVDGKTESVRIIGINAPESTIKKECFGTESSAKAKEFLTGKWIRLEQDESQSNRDKYNRLLRYVWFDSGTDFGRRMIEEGYAQEYTYSTPYSKQAQYKETHSQAKNKSRGLWASDTCAGTSTAVKTRPATSPTPRPTPSPKPTTPAPSQSSGVVKKSRTGICHAPGTTYYNRTTNFTSFNSLQACLNSGGRMPLR